MHQVGAPTRSDDYFVGTADYGKNGPVSYVPGELVDIHIRVRSQLKKYLGILIYAVQNDLVLGNKPCPSPGCNSKDEVKVGSWEPVGDLFKTSCDGKALTHTSAVLKNDHHVLRFRAPPVGSGDIFFRVIVKQGSTNGGFFYWPMTSGDLMLMEGSSIVSSETVFVQTSTHPVTIINVVNMEMIFTGLNPVNFEEAKSPIKTVIASVANVDIFDVELELKARRARRILRNSLLVATIKTDDVQSVQDALISINLEIFQNYIAIEMGEAGLVGITLEDFSKPQISSQHADPEFKPHSVIVVKEETPTAIQMTLVTTIGVLVVLLTILMTLYCVRREKTLEFETDDLTFVAPALSPRPVCTIRVTPPPPLSPINKPKSQDVYLHKIWGSTVSSPSLSYH